MDILFFMFLAAGATAVGLAMLAIWEILKQILPVRPKLK